MAKKKKTNSKIVYGNVELPEGFNEPRNAKVLISLRVDGETLAAFKEAAKKTSHGEYQTLMREKLREAMFGKEIDPQLRETIREVVREELNKWRQRVQKGQFPPVYRYQRDNGHRSEMGCLGIAHGTA